MLYLSKKECQKIKNKKNVVVVNSNDNIIFLKNIYGNYIYTPNREKSVFVPTCLNEQIHKKLYRTYTKNEQSDNMANTEKEIENLKKENEKLKQKNEQLERGTTPSRLKVYQDNNKNLRNTNKNLRQELKEIEKQHKKEKKTLANKFKKELAEKGELEKQVNELKKKSRDKYINLENLQPEQLEVYERTLRDFNNHGGHKINNFPDDGTDNLIFDHYKELCNKYPNKDFIRKGLNSRINHYINLKKAEINVLNEKREILEKVYEEQTKNDNWEEEFDDKIVSLAETITIDDIEKKIVSLNEDITNIDLWRKLINNDILPKNNTEMQDIKTNLYYEIINEFDRLYSLMSNLRNIYTYKANIYVVSDKDVDILSSLAAELEKQLGLCQEPNTLQYFYNNGEGRFVRWQHNNKILQAIQNNTKFIKTLQNGEFIRSGRIISSPHLFQKVPQWVQQTNIRNDNIIGYNNCFVTLNPQNDDITQKNLTKDLKFDVPLLPLRNTKTELYIDDNISGGAMEDIFNKCFHEEDAKSLLAYLGCCLYDKGYTQRQESVFLMSKGETGKTTLIKAFCEIFDKWEAQVVEKLSDDRFGLSMFGKNDCIIIDEVQGAKSDFAQKLKIISTGSNLVVEQKNKDTINVPAIHVPHVWFIGNQFPESLYNDLAGEGVFRRVLLIVPKASIKDLGYTWEQLIEDNCKQWLVQQATKIYFGNKMHKSRTPINFISDEEKEERVKKCTYPERYFLQEHFEVVYNDDGTSIDKDTKYYITYDQIHTFINNVIYNEMYESTISIGNKQTFIREFKIAMSLPNSYNTKNIYGNTIFWGIRPISDEAIEFLEEDNS